MAVSMASLGLGNTPLDDRNQDATIYVGNLDEKVNESVLWELFLQAGPVSAIHMPKDRVSGNHQGFGFVEFLTEQDADYALKIMNMIKLFGKPIRVNKAATHEKNMDVGANVFIGNLDPELDEKTIYDIFSAFGVVLQAPKIMRDVESGSSKGFAFINYASFEASDAAIAAMNGQCLNNRAITVSYAFKKDAKGERHGSNAERLLATTNPLNITDRPHQLFADAPPVPANIQPGTENSEFSLNSAGDPNGNVTNPAPPILPVNFPHLPPPHFSVMGQFPNIPPPPPPPLGLEHFQNLPHPPSGMGKFINLPPPPPLPLDFSKMPHLPPPPPPPGGFIPQQNPFAPNPVGHFGPTPMFPFPPNLSTGRPHMLVPNQNQFQQNQPVPHGSNQKSMPNHPSQLNQNQQP